MFNHGKLLRRLGSNEKAFSEELSTAVESGEMTAYTALYVKNGKNPKYLQEHLEKAGQNFTPTNRTMSPARMVYRELVFVELTSMCQTLASACETLFSASHLRQ